MLTITIDARSIVPVANAYAQAGIAAPIAIARALNWTGNKARTQVARTLARDTGVGYGVIRNALRTTPASPAKLTYEIGVSGAHIPLAEFHARQTRRGVSAAPWGHRRVFPHTFIVEQLGGQVFKREGRARLPMRFAVLAYVNRGALLLHPSPIVFARMCRGRCAPSRSCWAKKSTVALGTTCCTASGPATLPSITSSACRTSNILRATRKRHVCSMRA